MFKDFKRKIRKSETLITYAIFSSGIISIFSLTYSFFFILPLETKRAVLQILLNLQLDPHEIFLTTLNFSIIFFIIKGIISSPSSIRITKADMETLLPLPLNLRTFYLAKYLRTLPKSMITNAIIMFIVSPLLFYLNKTFIESLYLAVSILIFILFLQLAEIVSRFAVTPVMKILNKYVKTILIALISVSSGLMFFIVPLFNPEFYPIIILPSKHLIDIFFLTMYSPSIQIKHLLSLINMFLAFVVLFFVSYFLAEKFFASETNIEGKTKITKIPLFLGKARWNVFNIKNKIFLMILKDFWIDLRTQYIIYLLTSILISITILLLKDTIKLPEVTLVTFIDIRVIIIVFLLILIIFTISPSINSFINEAEQLWILKSLPVLPIEIVAGKFIYSLAITAIIMTPIAIALTSMLPQVEGSVLLALTPFIYTLSSAEGILASILFTHPSEKRLIPTTLSMFYLVILFTTIYPPIIIVYLTLYSPKLFLIVGTIIADLILFSTYKTLTKASKLLIRKIE